MTVVVVVAGGVPAGKIRNRPTFMADSADYCSRFLSRQVLFSLWTVINYTNLFSSLSDSALAFGSGAYQEMKAEVTEVPASHLIPDAHLNSTGTNLGFNAHESYRFGKTRTI